MANQPTKLSKMACADRVQVSDTKYKKDPLKFGFFIPKKVMAHLPVKFSKIACADRVHDKVLIFFQKLFTSFLPSPTVKWESVKSSVSRSKWVQKG